MKKDPSIDPFDALSKTYETMYEHVISGLNKAKEKTAPVVDELIREATDKARAFEEVTDEEAEKLTIWLKRDLDDVASFVTDTQYALKDWLGFETALIKTALVDLLLDTADKTTVELLRMKDNAHKPYDYHTGEITGYGTLVCDECGEKLHFHKPGKIPPCPKCHKTSFHRIQID